MVERKVVGLVFSYDSNWIAGAYYILNIIHALNTLKDSEKPQLVVLSDTKDTFNIVDRETKYPYLTYEQFPKIPSYSLLERLLNKVSKKLLNKRLIHKTPKYHSLDFLYPNQIKGLSDDIKKVNWIPDFQEDYLPHFFSDKEVQVRKKQQREVLCKSDVVVFSSNDAKKDFIRLYPDATPDLFVLQFAVTHPDFSNQDIEALRGKHKLPEQYFFAPNQFWAHKNHMVILEAVNFLKEKGIDITVAMSGKENDYRNQDNFKKLKAYIAKNKLEAHIKFLGFLPREEQLCLFSNARVIIQPSLFEGWSTVVEDAKALNKFVLLSDLKVHKEQMTTNVAFFKPEDSNTLAKLLEEYYFNQPKVERVDYRQNVLKFGKEMNELIQKYC